jgi:hypothetical protein
MVSIVILTCANDRKGWALTLLSTDNLSYASTAQTIGLNTGYFLSFTVFLAFNSPEFANKYFRSTPLDVGLVSLGSYLKFWGWMYILVTLWLARFKKEVPPTHSSEITPRNTRVQTTAESKQSTTQSGKSPNSPTSEPS